MNLSNSFFKSRLTLVFLINLCVCNTFGQAVNSKKEPDGKYGIGYREYKTQDTSRRYKPGVDRGNPLFFRPVEIDVWYPAKVNAKDAPLAFRYFVSLFERRASSFQDSTKFIGLTDELMQHFTVSDAVAKQNVRTSLKTRSYLNATDIKGWFPMIIYMSAYNGMSYENVPLFENLASHGYIVVSISSIGRYPGDMTTKYTDIIEQVNDADFAIKLMYNKNADTSKLGVAGWSYGGLAGSVLAMQNKSVKALLSLDGSEMYSYGLEKEEDRNFDELRQSKYFDPLGLQCSYAYLQSDHKDDVAADSVFYLQTRGGAKTYTRLINTEHEDFSCLQNPGSYTNTPYELVNKLSLDYFDQYLRDKKFLFDNAVAYVIKEKKGSALVNKILVKAKVISAPMLLKGKIIKAGSDIPIPYVSIGIPSGNYGTVADGDGKFSLSVDGALVGEVIRISSLGYKARNFKVEELVSLLASQPVITLDEQENQLQEVVIKAKKFRLKTIGNTSKSKFFSVGLPLNELGSEVGMRVSLGKRNVLLRSFNFNISYLRLDSATFRFNVYAIRNGKPAENLLTENILIGIRNKVGAFTIDLRPYELLMKGDVLVALEWIAGKTSTSDGALFFSAGLLASSYHRKTTEANWVRFKGLGAGFNLQIQENK